MTAPIELRLGAVAQVFNTLDPTPFREGDLAPEAEAYILDWAAELPARVPLALVIHLPAAEAGSTAAAALPAAIGGHFARRAEAATRDLRRNFREGRVALAIGLAILAACLGLALAVAPDGEPRGLARILQESLVIVGWVALWRPAEILLYDWLPIARRRTLLRRLAAAPVRVAGG